MKKGFVLLFILILIGGLYPVRVCGETTVSVRDCARQIIELVNVERRQSGLPPLEMDEGLARTAFQHAVDMINRSYFDHISPDGETPDQRIALHHRGILITATGENIWLRECSEDAVSTRELARRMVHDWMESPMHKANILYASYNILGVSVVIAGDRIYGVQHFAGIAGRIVPELPAMIRRGDTLRFGIDSLSRDLGSPKKFDLLNPVSLQPVSDPIYLRSGHLSSPAGTFRLRLYFLSPNGSDWHVYLGPLIRVP
ncbi:CAP domain-containing protein [bacterium]|nr:CAP domain-containing protein [candidate division CSSED10-310 bacterium]